MRFWKRKNQIPENINLINLGKEPHLFFWVMAANTFIVILAVKVPFIIFGNIVVEGFSIESHLVSLVYFMSLYFAACFSWMNITAINSLTQKGTLISLAVFSVTNFTGFVYIGMELYEFSKNYSIARLPREETLVIFTLLLLTGLGFTLTLSAFISVLWLKGWKLKNVDLSVYQIAHFSSELIKKTGNRLPSKNSGLGWALISAGVSIFIILGAIPDKFIYQNRMTVHIHDFMHLFGIYLFLRARSMFEPTAKQVLENDKRAPVLFLRSFNDDEHQGFMSANRALVDYSLESRLSSHFNTIGPFIAVGNPDEKSMVFGAARAILSNDEWQGSVIDWMDKSQLILIYAGITNWIKWELEQIIANGYASKLIICFPANKGVSTSQNKQLTNAKALANARLQVVKDAFKDTEWESAVCKLDSSMKLKAMSLGDNGLINVVSSGNSNRNAYHLSVLICHYLLARHSMPKHEPTH